MYINDARSSFILILCISVCVYLAAMQVLDCSCSGVVYAKVVCYLRMIHLICCILTDCSGFLSRIICVIC